MLKGHQSWQFDNGAYLLSTGTVAGPFEGKGPLAADFDRVHGDLTLNQDSWEKAEKMLLEEAADLAIQKSGIPKGSINFYVGGDLMNQIISSSFAARTLALPYLGVFAACSTSMESLALAAQLVDSGSAEYTLAGTSSHNCSAEKQFRYPTEYGSQKPPTAQWTVTGAGAALVGRKGQGPRVRRATIGRVVDMGIKDPYNMGAAMAPAAVDTIEAHFRDFGIEPGHYDLIVTGDLSDVGHKLAKDLLHEHKVPIGQTEYYDCGLMIYDRAKQSVQSGASGCACTALVAYGHLLKRLEKREINRLLVVATGALLSPLSYQQGESIPCIAHAVAIENGEGT
jgi:stage V sporulation protein AD